MAIKVETSRKHSALAQKTSSNGDKSNGNGNKFDVDLYLKAREVYLTSIFGEWSAGEIKQMRKDIKRTNRAVAKLRAERGF